MLDGDSADFRVQQNAYINLKDFRFGPTAGKGFSEQLTSNGGTLEIPNVFLPATGTNYCIGTAMDDANRRMIYFVWNSAGNHAIYCYDYVRNGVLTVLNNSSVTGGLNFDKNSLIHSARVENGSVYWTDDLNEPRRINIDGGIATNFNGTTTNTVVGLTRTFTMSIPSLASGDTMIMRRTVFNSPSTTTQVSTPIPLDWSNFPTISAIQVVSNGLNAYMVSIGAPLPKYSITIVSGKIVFVINNPFQFPGDPSLGTTISMSLQFSYAGLSGVAPYSFPVSQSVISWIRRQPGMPINAVKQFQSSPLVAVNQVDTEAFLFAYRYVYRDFELSALSSWSTIVNFNSTDQTFNRVSVSIPFSEKIDQDVIQIDVVAQYLLSGVSFIITSWRKNVPSDLAQINAHNSGVTALTYLFYNDVAGIALDTAYVNKLFDSVPIRASTIEMAKNRSFMADYVIGYDTPVTSSLGISTLINTFTPGGGGSLSGEWQLLTYYDIPLFKHTVYVLQTNFPIGPIPPYPNYYYTWSGTIPPFPATVSQADLTYRGHDATTTAMAIQGGGIDLLNPPTFTDQGQASVISGGSAPSVGFRGVVFKSYASYQVSISFKDNYGRECGVYTNAALSFMTSDPLTSGSPGIYSYTKSVFWTLSNANAINEIPSWAFYYSIDITKCLRTRFFIQGLGTVIYADKDVDGNYTFTTTTYSSNLAGVAIDLTLLVSNGQGYVLAEGDIVRVFVNSAYYSLSIIGQSAQYIICQLQDVGTLSGDTGNFEIYTPYKKQTDEPYFEVGQINQITLPGTSSRTYSTTAGTLDGDVSILSRNSTTASYITEVMSPNDKFYTRWFTNAGRPNFIDYIGQTIKSSSIAFSNTFIAGSQNNGLSTFDALDTQDISPDFGPISKLQLASKISKIGTVMLAICEGGSTASIYLGENTLISQTDDAVVAQANTVIGSIHELKGGFGTLNPESVFEFRGNIYWFDVQNGMIIQYADNGLFPISNYKLSRYWKLFADAYKALSQSQIEALGSRPFVFSGVDPYNGEILWTVPNTSAVPVNGFLPDYPSMEYPFDIWSGRAKTIVYKLYTDPNHWQGSFAFPAEYIFNLENNLFSFKAGKLYLHNQENQCNYYSVQYKPSVMNICNQTTTKPKVYNNYSAESNKAPSFIYFMNLYPYVQTSDLIDIDFKSLEGIWYAPIYRNKLDPAFGNNYPMALINGEKMRSAALYVMSEWDATTGQVTVKFNNVGYTLSIGQKV